MDADRIVAETQAGQRVSDNGRAFIEAWEGCRLTPYLDQRGYWTVGYGHKLQHNDTPQTVTLDQADVLLDFDLQYFADRVGVLVTAELSQPQFDAVCSLTYNIGAGAFAASSLRVYLNLGSFALVQRAMLAWNKITLPSGVQIVDDGLDKRRHAEAALFANGDYSGRP